MYNEQLLPIHDLGDANAGIYKIHGEINEYIDFPELRTTLRNAMEAELAKITDVLTVYDQMSLNANERAALEPLKVAWTDYRAQVTTTLDQVDNGEAEKAHASTVTGEFARQQDLVDQNMETVLAAAVAAGKVAHDLSDEVLANAIWLLTAGALGGLFLALGLGYWISRGITHNLGELKVTAEALAAGDLSRRADVHSGDEIEALAHAFNNMAANLEQRVETERQAKETLETGTQNLSAAAAEILAAVSEHTASASQQSAAVNQVTATVSEAQAVFSADAAKAMEVAELAQDAMRVGQEGADSVENILKGMQDIRTKVEGIARNILALSEQTQQIGDIIATVTDIADQSNILAINAAIEAAKAGDQGKGFAVVASEVRNLAEQSKQATGESALHPGGNPEGDQYGCVGHRTRDPRGGKRHDLDPARGRSHWPAQWRQSRCSTGSAADCSRVTPAEHSHGPDRAGDAGDQPGHGSICRRLTSITDRCRGSQRPRPPTAAALCALQRLKRGCQVGR